MNEYNDLVHDLQGRMREYGYPIIEDIERKEGSTVVIRTPISVARRVFGLVLFIPIVGLPFWKLVRKGLYAIVDVPEGISNYDQLDEYFRETVRLLNNRYLGFPWYKALYSYYVLLCTHELYQTCNQMLDRVSRAQFHGNVIGGIWIVDKENFESVGKYIPMVFSKQEPNEVDRIIKKWITQKNRE
jgi:hypothetical protein